MSSLLSAGQPWAASSRQVYINTKIRGLYSKVMHVLMYLEVVNPLFGLTKGSVPTAMIQAITDFYQWLEFLCPLSRCREETFSSGCWLATRKECRLSLSSFIFSWLTPVLRCSGVHITCLLFLVVKSNIVIFCSLPRYPYYILSIYDKSQAVLTWLR